jgi:release factor glutamine methyltransferase
MKISEALKNATEILTGGGISQPRREAASLLAFALKKNRTYLIAHDDYLLTESESENFNRILERRAAREPFQYIVGRQEFYGLDFIVTPDVLIPRPETELIVENAVLMLKNKREPRLCEVGIGSGCISVAILYEMQSASAVGLDISEKALQVAQQNAETHDVGKRLTLCVSDIFAALNAEKFDLVVSNPPYIPSQNIADLQPEVRDFEPLNALTDGADGFSIIRKIILDAPRFLKQNGSLLMEIGFDQSAAVARIFAPEIWNAVEYLHDLQGIPRTVKASLK